MKKGQKDINWHNVKEHQPKDIKHIFWKHWSSSVTCQPTPAKLRIGTKYTRKIIMGKWFDRVTYKMLRRPRTQQQHQQNPCNV